MIRATIESMQFTLAAAGISLLFAGCGGSSTEVRGDDHRLLASGPASGQATAHNPDPSAEPAGDARAVRPAPRDPADRLAFMERMRLQILHKTRRLP